MCPGPARSTHSLLFMPDALLVLCRVVQLTFVSSLRDTLYESTITRASCVTIMLAVRPRTGYYPFIPVSGTPIPPLSEGPAIPFLT